MRTLRAVLVCGMLMFGVGGAAADTVVAGTAARLDALVISIHGNVEEHRAAEWLNYERVEIGTAECMHAHGRSNYQPVPYVSWYEDFTDAELGYGTGGGTVFDSLTEHGRRMLLNDAAEHRIVRDRSDLTAEDAVVWNLCSDPYGHRAYYDVDAPTFSLATLLDPVQADPAVRNAAALYGDCMRDRYGYTIRERPDDLMSPKTSMEARFTADADCRRPAYEIAMRRLAPLITPWQQQHQAELAAVRQQWRRLVADAARLPR